MNIAALETFYWLATLKSVRETASRMRISKSVVSMRMAALQRSLGVELYTTRGHKIELTTAGQRVLKKCEAIVPLATELQEELRQSDDQSVVRIGMPDVAGLSWMPRFLLASRQQNPGVSIAVQNGFNFELVDAVRRDELDLTFGVGAIEDPTLSTVRLCDYTVKWVASPVLVAGRLPSNVVELARFPIILTRVESYYHHQLVEYFRWHDVANLSGLSPKHWVDGGFRITACTHLAVKGAGVTATPTILVADHLQAGSLVELPIKQELGRLELVAVYRRQNASELINKVLASAHHAIADYARTTDAKHFRKA